MSGSGSMATTSATTGATRSASWPGPAPRSSTRSTRRVALIVGDHVARAHGTAGHFPAVTLAIADFHRPGEATILRPIELRLERNRLIVRPIAQMRGHRRPIDNLAGIHAIIGVEGSLDLLKRAIDAIAMLAAHRTVVVQHKIGGGAADLTHLLNIIGALEVDERHH